MFKEKIEDKAARSVETGAADCARRSLHKLLSGTGRACETCGTVIPSGPMVGAEWARFGVMTEVPVTRDVKTEPNAEELNAVAEREKAREALEAALFSEHRAQTELSRLWSSSGPESMNRTGNIVRDESGWSKKRDALDAKVTAAREARVEAAEVFRRASVKATKLAQHRSWRSAAAMNTPRKRAEDEQPTGGGLLERLRR